MLAICARILAPRMCSLDRSRELVAGHLHLCLRRLHAMPTRQVQLDHPRSVLDLLTNGKAIRLSAVAQPGHPDLLHPPPPRGPVVGVPRGGELPRARNEPGPVDESLVDRTLQGRVDVIRGSRSDHTCESTRQSGLDIARRDHGRVGRRVLEAERAYRGADLHVRAVKVPDRHARHQGPTTEIDRFGVSRRRAGGGTLVDLGDPVVLEDNRRTCDGWILPVQQIDVRQCQSCHVDSLSLRCFPFLV